MTPTYVEELQTFYIDLPLAPNGTVREFLDAAGLPSEKWALHVIHDVLGAINQLEGLGILHCDVKPDKLLVGPNKEIIITDFSNSLPLGDPNVGYCHGTPGYAAPEMIAKSLDAVRDIIDAKYRRLRGTPIDARSDVWSLSMRR